MRWAALKLIKFYKITVSPLIDGIFGKGMWCRFEPTCSEYAYQAIYKYGVLKGSFLGFKRILKCHPFSRAGFDPLK